MRVGYNCIKSELQPSSETVCVCVGDIVKRTPAVLCDSDKKDDNWLHGRVIWIHPLGRFHVVEFGKGRRAVRESFMGVRK